MEDNDNSWVKSYDVGLAKQMLNEAIPSGTIVYPEIEALRYVISKQKMEIEQLQSKFNEAVEVIKFYTEMGHWGNGARDFLRSLDKGE